MEEGGAWNPAAPNVSGIWTRKPRENSSQLMSQKIKALDKALVSGESVIYDTNGCDVDQHFDAAPPDVNILRLELGTEERRNLRPNLAHERLPEVGEPLIYLYRTIIAFWKHGYRNYAYGTDMPREPYVFAKR